MSHKIVFEGDSRKQLRYHEISAIVILLDFFDSDITCIRSSSCKTPDLRIKTIEWELKSPIGDGPNTIEKILRKAAKQSKNIILDFSRTKMDNKQAIARTKFYLKNNKHSIQKLLVITKGHKIIDFKNYL